MRAPDGWESPRFQAVCVAWSWFRQSGVLSSRPPAGNASRWALNFIRSVRASMINKNRLKYFHKQSTRERFEKALFNLGKESPRTFLLVIISPCLLLAVVLSALVGVNNTQFWKFLSNVTPSEIEQIEVQRIDINGIGVGDPITLTDEVPITNFVIAIKTVQEYYPGRYTEINRTRVTIWLKNNHTVEFRCYTIQGYGKTIYVDNIWLKPNLYSFGNGNVQFPQPAFYNWLLSTGVSLE
jgi:hypothetical protein